jgi:hypothetical protein
MVCFQTKSLNLGKFGRALDWKMLIYFMTIWNILWRFGIFYDHFVLIWYIFSGFGIMYKENLATLTQNSAKSPCPAVFIYSHSVPACLTPTTRFQRRKKESFWIWLWIPGLCAIKMVPRFGAVIDFDSWT